MFLLASHETVKLKVCMRLIICTTAQTDRIPISQSSKLWMLLDYNVSKLTKLVTLVTFLIYCIKVAITATATYFLSKVAITAIAKFLEKVAR